MRKLLISALVTAFALIAPAFAANNTGPQAPTAASAVDQSASSNGANPVAPSANNQHGLSFHEYWNPLTAQWEAQRGQGGASYITPLDVRLTGTLPANAGQTYNIPLNGTASVGLTFTGITAANATIGFKTSNDGGTTYLTKGLINCSAPGANPLTLVPGIDPVQSRVDVSGATNLQITIVSGNGGNVTWSANLSTAPVACPNLLDNIDYSGTQAPQNTASASPNGLNLATLTGVAGKYTYITGFEITASGANLASCVTVSVTGLPIGQYFAFCVPAGTSTAATPLSIQYSRALRSSALGGNISVSMPALGAGNAIAIINLHGYTQ